MKDVVRAFVICSCGASLLSAQSRLVEVGIGLAQPRGALSEEHTIGPLFRGALTFVSENPVWRLRLEGSAVSIGTAARAGAGVRVQLDVVTLLLEVTPTFALMRSGAISDAWAVQYVPLTLGIAF